MPPQTPAQPTPDATHEHPDMKESDNDSEMGTEEDVDRQPRKQQQDGHSLTTLWMRSSNFQKHGHNLSNNIMHTLDTMSHGYCKQATSTIIGNDHELLSLTRAAHRVGRPHVSEASSPARVTPLAPRAGLRRRVALDLTTVDEHEVPSEFSFS